MKEKELLGAFPPDRPIPRRALQGMAPYEAGKALSSLAPTRFKLSSNEAPLGPSPQAVAAYHAAAEKLSVYSDGTARVLRKTLGQIHGIDPDRILCGAGSDEVLFLIAYAYLEAGNTALCTEHGFLLYPIVIAAAGATSLTVPEVDLKIDPEGFLKALTPQTRAIYIANPNNPTGTYLTEEELQRFHAALPSHVVLVVDEAYAEYAEKAPGYASALKLAESAPNLFVTRTFSKAYGLAGLRLGWGYGPPPMIEVMNRIRPPFNVNVAALMAGNAAAQDTEHLAKAKAHNTLWRPYVTEKLIELGLRVTPSAGNFILIHFPDIPRKTVTEVDVHLLSQGIILRRMEPYGFKNSLRMSIGTEEANNSVISALSEFFK